MSKEEAIKKLERALQELEPIVKESHKGISVYPNPCDKIKNYVSFAKALLEDNPQLNENQQVVLEYLKENMNDNPISNISVLADYDVIRYRHEKVYYAYVKLSYQEELEVLQTFAEWGLKGEAE